MRARLPPSVVTPEVDCLWAVPVAFATITTTGVHTMVPGPREASAATVYTTEQSQTRGEQKRGLTHHKRRWFVGQTRSCRCAGTPRGATTNQKLQRVCMGRMAGTTPALLSSHRSQDHLQSQRAATWGGSLKQQEVKLEPAQITRGAT